MGAAASDYFTSYADVQYGYLDAELGIENLHLLAAKGDFHGVSMRLKKGLNPNATMVDDDDDFAREDTPMICAARGYPLQRGHKRHLKTLEMLCHFGGDLNKWNFLEQTPLYVACEKNLVRVAQWLVAHGADVNKMTKVGLSPLLCAYRNENVALVELLLEAGAHVINPPHSFSRIQFPTIAKELRGENVDQQVNNDDGDDDSSSSSSSDDGGERNNPTVDAGARPKCSHNLFRPLWKLTKPQATDSVQQHEQQPLSSAAAVAVATAPMPTVAATTPVSEPKNPQLLMNRAIESQMTRQHDKRASLLHELDEKRLLVEQKEYREKLAVGNAKRKQTARRQRNKASYDKYVAQIEQKRLLLPLASSREIGDAHHQQQMQRPSTTTSASSSIGLYWTKLDESPLRGGGQRTHRPRPATTDPVGATGRKRPTWVAHEVATTHVSKPSSTSSGDGSNDIRRRDDGDAVMLEQCQKIHDSLQRSRDRREQLRMAYTAPIPSQATRDNPPLGHNKLLTDETGGLLQLPPVLAVVVGGGVDGGRRERRARRHPRVP